MPAFRSGLARAALLGAFVLFGGAVGVLGVLWPELIRTLRLSAATFGLTQLVPPLVAMGLMLLGGSLGAGVGTKRLTVVGLALLGGAALMMAGAGGVGELLGALAVAGAGMGLLEAAANGAALDWERVTGRTAMNAMHAGFSAGAMAGALVTGALLTLGWSYERILGLLAALAGLMLTATLLVRYPPAVGPPGSLDPGMALRLLLSRRVLVSLALLAAVGILGESVTATWSVVHLRTLGAPALVGGSAFALSNATMLVGRILNGRVVARRGPRTSLLASGAGIVMAGALLMVPGCVWTAVAGFALLGLAGAGIVPTVLSAAGQAAPGQSGSVAGGMMAVAYAGFVLYPPLIGWVAELASLRAALLSVGLSGVGVLWLARTARLPRPTG